MPASLPHLGTSVSEATTTLGLVALAELGDKSQLMCVLLAARHGPSATVAGAVLAFAVLNAVAVLVGGGLGHLIPAVWAQGAAAVAFLAFGVQGWRTADETEDPAAAPLPTRWGPMLTTATLIGAAELGDKTQLAVAALSTVQSPVATWVGATVALTLTSASAAVLGDQLLRRVSPARVRRVAAVLFIGFGVWMLTRL